MALNDKNKNAFLLLAICVFASCNDVNKRIEPALESITIDETKNHISVLASDDFLGRAPTTVGEEKTIKYLARRKTIPVATIMRIPPYANAALSVSLTRLNSFAPLFCATSVRVAMFKPMVGRSAICSILIPIP